ncbi:MAG: hypothetical protein IJH07_08310 [Ruminococcus sp.]|nr:hypothetical protein [Ruminococcus sp.]
MNFKEQQSVNHIFSVGATRAEHRKSVKNDYIIVMNSNVKKRLDIGRYAVVKKLFINTHVQDPEWRNMVAFGRVVVDDALDDSKILVDQTLRNALGMEYNDISGYQVKLCRLKRTIQQRIRASYRPGQFLYMRVNYPSLNDIEKNNCRISSDSMRLLDSKDGNSIWVECCSSDYRHNVKRLVNEIIYEGNRKKYNTQANIIDQYFSGIVLPEALYIKDIPALREKKGADYINALAELILDCKSDEDKAKKKYYQKYMNSIVAYGEWINDEAYRLVDEKIIAHENDMVSEQRIRKFQEDNKDSDSFEELYPDSDRIFNMNPDLETIRLDKYYRDILDLNVLDSVKIKRHLVEGIKDDIIEYGLVFTLTLFAAVAAITPENLRLMIFTVPISILFTFIIVFIRTK